jgi:hypothetical protein
MRNLGMRKTKNEGRTKGRKGQGPGNMGTKYFIHVRAPQYRERKIELPQHLEDAANFILRSSDYENPGMLENIDSINKFMIREKWIDTSEAAIWLWECGILWISRETTI